MVRRIVRLGARYPLLIAAALLAGLAVWLAGVAGTATGASRLPNKAAIVGETDGG